MVHAAPKDPSPNGGKHHGHVKADGVESMELFTSVSIYQGRTEMQPYREGTLEVAICRECGFVKARCLHEQTRWEHRDDCDGFSSLAEISSGDKTIGQNKTCTGCLLQCQLCGMDVT